MTANRKNQLVTAVCAAAAGLLCLLNPVKSDGELFAVHGSGTTNPSKCFWLIMGQLMDQARDPVHLTYRAVGSSTGIEEFFGGNETDYTPFNDFGSGDIPVPSHKYGVLKDNGHEMLHLPFALGAISIFHSIPGVPSGTNGLNLTGCLIAKIFRRQIEYWDNEEILDLNPNLKEKLPRANYPIKLAHRVKGSSSTASVTAYINTSCPELWSDEWTGSKIEWPTGDDNVMPCEGSGGMTQCIRDNPGTIGYIDSGHGHEEGLKEIELKNKAGTLLSSKKAAEKGGIAAAADNNPDFPTSVDQDFGEVDFLDKDGEWTWPIVAMSYVFVRKNITYIDNPVEQGLLIAFLKSLYDKDTFEQCTQFGFTPAPESVRTKALAGINNIVTSGDAPEWIFETSTNPGVGQGPYVLSAKRRSYAEYERSQLQSQIEACEANVDTVTAEMRTLSSSSSDGNTFTDSNQTQLTFALAMASISMVLWALLVVFIIVKRPFGGGGGGGKQDTMYDPSAENGNGDVVHT